MSSSLVHRILKANAHGVPFSRSLSVKTDKSDGVYAGLDRDFPEYSRVGEYQHFHSPTVVVYEGEAYLLSSDGYPTGGILTMESGKSRLNYTNHNGGMEEEFDAEFLHTLDLKSMTATTQPHRRTTVRYANGGRRSPRPA